MRNKRADDGNQPDGNHHIRNDFAVLRELVSFVSDVKINSHIKSVFN
jgi:hypothetical protein